MHVVVVAKNTPDTEATITVDAGGNASWGDKMVVNPWDEYSITEAVLLKASHNVKTSILTVGDAAHDEALKHGLAIGVDQAIRVWDPALEEADSLATAKAVAAAIQKLGDVSLVIFGREFADIASDAHIYQTARLLGWTMLGSVAKIDAVDFAGGTIRVQRLIEAGTQTVSGRLPAVISVVKDINEPKYPTFIGIRKAAKAEIPVWSTAELGASLDAGKVSIERYQELPRREGTVEMIEGASAQEKAEKLVEKLFQEKVL